MSQLRNMTQVAGDLGLKSTWVLKGIKIASAGQPDCPFTGRYTTKERVLEWIANHQDFVASHHLRKLITSE